MTLSIQKIVVILLVQGSLLFADGEGRPTPTKPANVCYTVTTCLQVLERDPKNVAALEHLGLAYEAIHHFRKAQTALSSAGHLDPQNARIQYELGGVEEELHLPERALEAYEQSVAIDPYSPSTLLNLGATCAELHRYEDAVKAYRAVITLKPDFGKAYYDLGNAYSDLKRHGQARRAFVDAVQSVCKFCSIGLPVFVGKSSHRSRDTEPSFAYYVQLQRAGVQHQRRTILFERRSGSRRHGLPAR